VGLKDRFDNHPVVIGISFTVLLVGLVASMKSLFTPTAQPNQQAPSSTTGNSNSVNVGSGTQNFNRGSGSIYSNSGTGNLYVGGSLPPAAGRSRPPSVRTQVPSDPLLNDAEQVEVHMHAILANWKEEQQKLEDWVLSSGTSLSPEQRSALAATNSNELSWREGLLCKKEWTFFQDNYQDQARHVRLKLFDECPQVSSPEMDRDYENNKGPYMETWSEFSRMADDFSGLLQAYKLKKRSHVCR
jgi:hypothetical protein